MLSATLRSDHPRAQTRSSEFSTRLNINKTHSICRTRRGDMPVWMMASFLLDRGALLFPILPTANLPSTAIDQTKPPGTLQAASSRSRACPSLPKSRSSRDAGTTSQSWTRRSLTTRLGASPSSCKLRNPTPLKLRKIVSNSTL